MTSRYHALEILQQGLSDRCPEPLFQAVTERLAPWRPEPPVFFRLSTAPPPLDGGEPSAELHVCVLVGNVLLDVRAATDGFSESLIPLRAIDRLRLIRKPDRDQIEIRHGDCISWIERKEDDAAGADLEAFLLGLQRKLA
ncbi:MAG: hypothetical protein ABIO70_24500 [Pseudomonadota bacterium]